MVIRDLGTLDLGRRGPSIVRVGGERGTRGPDRTVLTVQSTE